MTYSLARIEQYGRQQGWWYDEPYESYMIALSDLGIAEDSDFFRFFVYAEDGPTFCSRNHELAHIGWFMTNSSDLKLGMTNLQAMGLSDAYVPLDTFAGEGGYVYNKQTDQVMYIEAGALMQQALAGTLEPQWASFAEFLHWYFELDSII
ncbi:hypothetical protein SK066_03655 [Paenibacillus hunanensis]|uniref:hypothetical protein n=1 Tax=Paenibacillus hunanensis TaxID=539262 RepID=UPI002A6A7E4E|nr:hypothetical protein [Paenibacillus hunanensis]WPP42074.1 hypothetical protein SK066_03655 [Paenibacillus hunanensis]